MHQLKIILILTNISTVAPPTPKLNSAEEGLGYG